MTARFAFLDWPAPIAFAHQGGAGDSPENTVRAFEHAVTLGYRYVETDVHATTDGVVVAFHDHSLDRMTDATGRIAALPWRDVQHVRVAGSEPLARLEEILGTWPDLRVNIDPKHSAALGPLIKVLHGTNAIDRVCVGSFSDRRLRDLRRVAGGELCTALGPLAVARVRLANGAGFRMTRALAAGCAQVPTRFLGVTIVDERFVARAKRLGLAVHVWTIDDPAEMDRLLDLGVDGIMTDRPAVLRAVLERRKQWVA